VTWVEIIWAVLALGAAVEGLRLLVSENARQAYGRRPVLLRAAWAKTPERARAAGWMLLLIGLALAVVTAVAVASN
jgi:hypothetical protein